jgi:3-hydroxyacyl-[acyl-carrier-protein] dehydratase
MRLEYFQMIDRIVALNVGERSIRSVCTVPKESTIFEGHFPGYPLMPGVLLTECMAQTTGWLVSAVCGFATMPILVGIKEAKFRTFVNPGDDLEFEGKVEHEGSGFVVGSAVGRRSGKVVCEAGLTYRLVPYPNPKFREAVWQWAERINVPVKEFVK